jgi:predicted RNA-binding Zn ribbon-like protein
VDVSLVVDFLNTLDVEEATDVLADEADWRRWAGERHLVPDGLPAARAARNALRAAAGDTVPERATLEAAVTIELGSAGPTLRATTAIGAVLASAVRLAVLGEWPRVKICASDDCRWAFCDRSRNRSRTWCSMRVCGNREKARSWRERTAREYPSELPT